MASHFKVVMSPCHRHSPGWMGQRLFTSVEYTLTDLGYSLKPILDAMWNWGEAYQVSQKGQAT